MNTSISYNESDIVDSHLSKFHALENEYNEAVQSKSLIVKDEASRRLRLRILLLEHDNEDLQDKLALGDDRIDLLEHEGVNLRVQIESAQEETRRQESELRAQAREVHALRAEVTSMNGVTMDSTKLLTEKLLLTRELATLKPELEHLRSQATYQQTILSEKLALQRQVSTLEVELETEKRAVNRAVQQSSNTEQEAEYQSRLDRLQKGSVREKRELTRRHNEMESEFQSQLEELRRESARERREFSTIAKERENEIKSSEIRYTIIESKLEQMRTKLRAVKDQLKESQNEVIQIRTAAAKATEFTIADAPAKNSQKRAALEMSLDNGVGTPDGVTGRGKRPATKRGRPDQASVGEKSMFSITPFLNRTISMAPENPVRDEESENEEGGEQVVGETELSDRRKKAVEVQQQTFERASLKNMSNTRGRKKVANKVADIGNNILGEAKPNATKSKPVSKKVLAVTKLEMVDEEVEEENVEPEDNVPEIEILAEPIAAFKKPSKLQLKQVGTEEAGPKVKKRKLLGGTLFDDEDGETTKRPAKLALGNSKLLSKGVLAGPSGKLKGRLASGNSFGAFSPLKKDHRGPRASFLV